MPSSRSLPANVLANWTGYGVSVLVGFFLSPLVVNHLGPSAYGVWTLLAALTAYLGLLDLGIRSAVTRYVARSESRGEHAAAARIVSTALATFAVTAALALVVSTGLGLVAPSVFHIPAEYRVTTAIVAVLAGASTGVALVNGAFGGRDRGPAALCVARRRRRHGVAGVAAPARAAAVAELEPAGPAAHRLVRRLRIPRAGRRRAHRSGRRDRARRSAR